MKGLEKEEYFFVQTSPQSAESGNKSNKEVNVRVNQPAKVENLVESEASKGLRIADPAAFFKGKDVVIYSPPDHLLTRVYDQSLDKSFGEFKCKLLDAAFGDNGEPLWGFVQFRDKGARKFVNIDLIPLEGCSISFARERDDYDVDDENIKTEKVN